MNYEYTMLPFSEDLSPGGRSWTRGGRAGM